MVKDMGNTRKMTYEEWCRRCGDTILSYGPQMAALLKNVPLHYAERYNRESEYRNKVARSLGGQNEFFIPFDVKW